MQRSRSIATQSCRSSLKSQVLANTGIHKAGGRKPAQQSQTGGESAGCIAKFRPSRDSGLQYGLGYDLRAVSVLDDLFHSPRDGRAYLEVVVERNVRLHEVRVERRLDVGGLNDGDPDAHRAQL